MACVNADGTITATAKALLKTIESPLTPEEIAGHLSLPLFKIRSSLRELTQAGLVIARGEKFQISEQGKEKIQAP